MAAGSGLAGTEVEPELLAGASSLGSGTRIIGVYEERWAAELGPLVVALYGVRDPGNVGTILRSASAFDASVAFGPGCADPFGVKAVRASMGAVFRVRIQRLTEGGQELPRPSIALVPAVGEPFLGPLGTGTLLLGAERDGLPREVVERADRAQHIPMAEEAESLNAAMAATVALYEARRVR